MGYYCLTGFGITKERLWNLGKLIGIRVLPVGQHLGVLAELR
jgi:hypothetical protein